MQTPNEAPRVRHSAFAAAFFSFLLPGLGQIYAGRWRRGAFFMVPWLVAVALIAGQAFSMGLKDFGLQLGLDTTWLQYLLGGIAIDLIWRLISVLDAFWISRAPASVQDAPLRRLGSGVGLLAIIGVLLGSHATIAAPAYHQYDAVRCATDTDCTDGQVDATPGPDESFEPPPSLVVPVAEGTNGPGGTSDMSQGPTPTPLPEWTGGRLNVLLVGTNGALTDTLIVVSIDPDTKQVAFIGIPRDTIGFTVPSSLGAASRYYGGVFPARVNQIFYYARAQPNLFPGDSDRKRGYGALKEMIGATLGLDINYYLQVDMDSFRDVIDTLGGAIVDVQLPVYDSRYASNDGRGAIKLYIPPGIHYMDGAQALAYSRSRHSSSDFDRSSRQMRMITALRNQIDIPNLLGDIGQIQDIIKKDIRTDVPSNKLPQLAQLAQSIDIDKRISLQLTPPKFSTQCSQIPSNALCKPAGNSPYGLIANVAAIRKAVKNVFSTDPKTIEQEQALNDEAAVVQVLNGTTSSNQRTTNISDYLDYLGFDSSVPPVNAGKADRDDYAQTVITVYNGAAEDMPTSVQVLEDELGVKAVTEDDPNQKANIVVIVGSDTPNKRAPVGS